MLKHASGVSHPAPSWQQARRTPALWQAQPMTPSLGAEHIERVIPAGRERVVIDLFRGAGPLSCGLLIHDFEQTYRIERILVCETPYCGARVAATALPPEPEEA
ncbi:hypothetical protein MF271_18585 (plasmid) [Deinococcus sp. KNUC1210]|uniref:hypothetical protein n=1 Tax=Deinococcus sp. KNUC1210 TaxID=2917691 RepID=UPI001EF0FF22|nr:hypothetical protein [Deinococcus sp. KNUC1210]ULH17139.1 hypothetical protein MF271_18585 [Deinococcus sp. KNUC1210]